MGFTANHCGEKWYYHRIRSNEELAPPANSKRPVTKSGYEPRDEDKIAFSKRLVQENPDNEGFSTNCYHSALNDIKHSPSVYELRIETNKYDSVRNKIWAKFEELTSQDEREFARSEYLKAFTSHQLRSALNEATDEETVKYFKALNQVLEEKHYAELEKFCNASVAERMGIMSEKGFPSKQFDSVAQAYRLNGFPQFNLGTSGCTVQEYCPS